MADKALAELNGSQRLPQTSITVIHGLNDSPRQPTCSCEASQQPACASPCHSPSSFSHSKTLPTHAQQARTASKFVATFVLTPLALCVAQLARTETPPAPATAGSCVRCAVSEQVGALPFTLPSYFVADTSLSYQATAFV